MKKEKIEFLKKIREKFLNTKTKCRFCGDGEDNNHNEGIHIINSMIEGEIKV